MIRNDLEEKCRQLLKASQPDDVFALPAKLIEREMTLTLEHLERSRRTKSESMKGLDTMRQSIDNRLANLRGIPYEPSDRWIERDRIRNQLTNVKVKLESQRLKVVSDYENELQSLEVGLLKLLNKHELLNMENGDQDANSEA